MASKIIPIALLGAAAIGVQTGLIPFLEFAGMKGEIPTLRTGNCKPVEGLHACEDQWIHRASGISYLPCSNLPARAAWCPAIDHLSLAVQDAPGDTIQMYDTRSGKVTQIGIPNLPAHLVGKLHLHAIEAWIDPKDSDKLTFFLNNHGVPVSAASGQVEDPHAVGADSTVEIFETRLGSETWTHVKSVKHPLLVTPNNLVATGPRSFYASNDHVDKTSWKRSFYLAYAHFPPSASSIVHCDASGGTSECIPAATGIFYPNGITRGPENTIYVASTVTGEIKQFQIQADYTLVEGDTVARIPSPVDNIAVDEKGAIIVATLPDMLGFVGRSKNQAGLCPATVWKVTNETSDQKFYGKKYHQERLWSDGKGDLAPGMTNAQLYKGKLYVTGLTTPALMVCSDPYFAN
ncbi:calcium-dependent phosphotriesterase [Cystobasidium minutum MCA 4210]|uniref:calcium-dependent phosphotriesterase n=1 Tax=Cystobasidium minutum MCA 4210 TaxID=1397322 RepID=UPI0034CFB803|eukprot:jgi/Rhomi1/164927/fgenesh1_kg.1_\